MLYLTATVAYTDPPLDAKASSGGDVKQTTEDGDKGKYTRVQIRVDSKVRNIEHGETKPTGQFNYTFTVDRDIRVMPQTYSEFMIWVDARRRAERVGASVEGLDGGESKGEGRDDGRGSRVTE